MPSDEQDIAAFQAALLELFHEPGMDPQRARERLASDPAFAPFGAYVQDFEPRMLETAIALTQRWGVRFEPRP